MRFSIAGGAWRQRPGGLELVAGQLEHPGARRVSRNQSSLVGLKHRGRDVAGHLAVHAGAAQQVAGERGDGGLAVGAGDREHRARAPSCHGEQLDVAEHRQALRAALAHDPGSSSESPGLTHTSVDAVEQRRRERRRRAARRRSPSARGGSRRRVGDAHACRLRARPSAPPTTRCRPSPRTSTRRPASGVGAGRGSSWKAGSRIIGA